MRLILLAAVLGLGCVSPEPGRDRDTELREVKERLREEVARNARLEKELRDCNAWLNKYRARYSDDFHFRPSGVVTAVKGNRVSISLGSDDGVRAGDSYNIRRGSTYVGQITITDVYEQRSVGEFDEEFKGHVAPPRISDVAERGGY